MWSSGIKHHQQINRIALKKLALLTNTNHFPDIKKINYFEGNKGPDAMKAKIPGQHVPEQYYDPFDDDDNAILEDMSNHFNHLVEHLKADNPERAAFEASWLAHLLVDGLTPPHHHPYNESLKELEAEGDAKLIRSEVVRVSSDKITQYIKSNWKIWGAKGIITSHILFEGGVAFISAPLNANSFEVTKHDINEARELGIGDYFMKEAREVALLDMYDEYIRQGWSSKLAKSVRDELMPKIITLVTIAWYIALAEAGYATKPPHKK